MKNSIVLLSTILGLIIAFFTFYYQVIYKQKNLIEIQCLDKTQLTQFSQTEGLSGYFFYNDSIPVKNLWKLKYLLKNIGDINIVGEGGNSILIGDKVPLYINDALRVLDIKIINSSNEAILMDNKLKFKQWKPTEFIEISAFVECEEGTIPSLTINSRDILNADVTYSEVSTEITHENKKLISYLPKNLANTIKWITVIISLLLYILAIPVGMASLKEASQNGTKTIVLVLFIVFSIILLMPFLWVFP